ncbi:MAG: ParB N-terminal domain-containing protein [Planctomycetes bacterium]|nr:ParB N-terminal domain-containing protein [Planctomycetota bacterium]
MKLTNIDVRSITESDWNPNCMDAETRSRLRTSIERFELVNPLVVRQNSTGRYETIGGAKRLSILLEMQVDRVDCVVVEATDAEARLLAQALNRITGTDDPVKRQTSLDLILENIPKGEVLKLLPDAANSIGQVISFDAPSLIEHLESFEESRSARLRHFSAQLTNEQLVVIDQAIAHASEHGVVDDRNPNKTGNALFHICQKYLG